MIHWLYERHLKKGLELLPGHICFMIESKDMIDYPEKLFEVITWCRDMGIENITIHISTPDPATLSLYITEIQQISSIAHLTLHNENEVTRNGEGMEVVVAIGMSGRKEITECIKEMARSGVRPDLVDEQTIEAHLTFKYEPDLIIKTGSDQLTDFLIWQSVYAELFFSDVNWKYFRKVDFLRALRDYQVRKRRYGR